MVVPARSDVARFVAWFALVLLVLYLVLLGGGWGGIYFVQIRVVSLALVAGVLVAWAAWAIGHPAWRPRSSIWPALVLPLGAMALSTALSRTPRIGVEYLAWSVILVALYLLLQRLLASDFFRPRLMDLAVVLCAAIGLLYVAVCLSSWIEWWTLIGGLAVPPLRPGFANLVWGNPSAVMTIEVLLWASAVARLGWATRGRRVATILLTLLVLCVIVLTGSRAGWLGLAIAVASVGLVLVLVAGRRAWAAALGQSRALVVGGVVVALAGAGLVVALLPAIGSRVDSGGEELRATFFDAALRMGAEAPLVGQGPGMWVAGRIRYTPAGATDYYIPHAHDIYVQTFAELGVVGLAAGIVAVLCLLWLLARAVRDPDEVRRRTGWLALFATVYFGAHQLLDFYPNMPAALFAFALPIAWLDATSDRSLLEGRVPRPLRRAATVSLAAACIAAAGMLAWTEASALQLGEAVAAADRGDWQPSLASASAAVGRDPAMPPGQFVLGLAAANAGDLAAAAGALEAAAEADDLPVAWLDLAAVQAASGDDAAAQTSLGRAMRFGDQQAAIAFAAGDLYLRTGRTTSAHDAFVHALALAPSLAGDAYWRSSPAIATLWPSVLEDALASMPPQTAFDAALSAGDPDRARAIAASIGDPEGRALSLDVIDAWGGDPAAYADLARRAAENPRDVATLVWAGRVAAHLGDTARADSYRRWTDILLGGAAASIGEIRVGHPAGPGETVAGISGQYYGTYTYRRPTPLDQIVRDLPALVYR